MDAGEALGIEGGGQILDGFPKHEGLVPHVQARIVVCGFDPFDLPDRDEAILGPVGDQEPLRGFSALRCRSPQFFEEVCELGLSGERRLRG